MKEWKPIAIILSAYCLGWVELDKVFSGGLIVKLAWDNFGQSILSMRRI